MQAFLQDVLASIPTDGDSAVSWKVEAVPTANLKLYEGCLMRMFEVIRKERSCTDCRIMQGKMIFKLYPDHSGFIGGSKRAPATCTF